MNVFERFVYMTGRVQTFTGMARDPNEEITYEGLPLPSLDTLMCLKRSIQEIIADYGADHLQRLLEMYWPNTFIRLDHQYTTLLTPWGKVRY